MSNSFSKEERVLFEDVLEGFNDELILSRNVAKFNTDQTTMERANDTIWRPQPYIMRTFDGSDQTSNYQGNTQLSVPATIGFWKSAPWIMTALELRDAIQEGSLYKAGRQKLASDINIAVMNVAALQGTIFSKRSTAASGFDDVAAIEAIFNEQGIQQDDRYGAYSTRDYNGMASNLAARQTVQGKVQTAYEKAQVGRVASFELFKLDYAVRQAAAAGGGSLTINTLVAGANYYTPRATSVATTGESSNVDNRYQTVTISSTTSVAAGDAFTIAGVNAVHHITKGDTGQLKTFRVISVPSSTTLVISPPIISGQGSTDAEIQYQNVTVTGSATAAIVFLNTVAASVNPFWHKDAIEILPGSMVLPSDAGVSIMRGTTEQGIQLIITKSVDQDTFKIKYRIDTRFGVCNKQPEMTGIQMFSQT